MVFVAVPVEDVPRVRPWVQPLSAVGLEVSSVAILDRREQRPVLPPGRVVLPDQDRELSGFQTFFWTRARSSAYSCRSPRPRRVGRCRGTAWPRPVARQSVCGLALGLDLRGQPSRRLGRAGPGSASAAACLSSLGGFFMVRSSEGGAGAGDPSLQAVLDAVDRDGPPSLAAPRPGRRGRGPRMFDSGSSPGSTSRP